MTCIQTKIKESNLIKWFLKNSEITFQDSECFMSRFDGKLTRKMHNEITYFFKNNGANKTGGTINVGQGSINLYTSKWKGDLKVTFSTCLANEFKNN